MLVAGGRLSTDPLRYKELVSQLLLFPGIAGFLVAVKQLKTEDEAAYAELTREAAFMAQLNHDNVVKLYGVVTVRLEADRNRGSL